MTRSGATAEAVDQKKQPTRMHQQEKREYLSDKIEVSVHERINRPAASSPSLKDEATGRWFFGMGQVPSARGCRVNHAISYVNKIKERLKPKTNLDV